GRTQIDRRLRSKLVVTRYERASICRLRQAPIRRGGAGGIRLRRVPPHAHSAPLGTSKSSARVFLPSSVSNSYSFSTGTQGRSRRLLLISSSRFACSASSLASSSRATCHSSRVPILCSGISSPSSPIPVLPREPNPSLDRTLPGSRKETRGDPETHRNDQLPMGAHGVSGSSPEKTQ